MIPIPQGAKALLIAMNTPAPNGLIGIPTLLWGRPGVGKSSFIEGLANEQWEVMTIIASIYDPTDFSGLPKMTDNGVEYLAPAWIDKLADAENSILFLDELSTCPPSVQAALLRVVFERRVGFKPLPENVRIVAAANPPDLMVGGWDLSPPMRNRFVHLNWDISTKTYLNALANGWSSSAILEIDPILHQQYLPKWKDLISAFLRIAPDSLHGDPSKDNYGYASPRTWDFVIHLLASCEVLNEPPSLELIEGCLGEGIAIALVEYLNNLKQPDPIDVLSKRLTIDVKTFNDGELFVLFNGMERILQSKEYENQFLNFTKTFLSLSQQVALSGKRDVIFVSLQKLAKKGYLTKVITKAQIERPDEYGDYLQQITQLFNEEGLVEFIDVLS